MAESTFDANSFNSAVAGGLRAIQSARDVSATALQAWRQQWEAGLTVAGLVSEGVLSKTILDDARKDELASAVRKNVHQAVDLAADWAAVTATMWSKVLDGWVSLLTPNPKPPG